MVAVQLTRKRRVFPRHASCHIWACGVLSGSRTYRVPRTSLRGSARCSAVLHKGYLVGLGGIDVDEAGVVLILLPITEALEDLGTGFGILECFL